MNIIIVFYLHYFNLCLLYCHLRPVIQYVNLGNLRSCMSVRFNRTGNLILGLRRRLTPILYSVNSPDRICTFYHSYYYNSCTMKSCTFAGEDDELVISGSDDFNLYVWRLSDIDCMYKKTKPQ